MKLRKPLILFLTLILLIILLVIFYPNRMFTDDFYLGEDTSFPQDIPQATFFVKTIKMGSFPLWNPYKACGVPFFETTSNLYYPTVILYSILPIEKAIDYSFLIHILISALFMFLLCREFNFSRLVSFFCVVSWIFSNTFQYYSLQGYLPRTISISFLPILIYLSIKVTNTDSSKKSLFFILATIVTALSITGGHPPLTAMLIYCTFVFMIFSLKNLRVMKTFLGIFPLALLLSIVYWGPVFVNPLKSIFSPGNGGHYVLSDLRNFFVPFTLKKAYIGKLGIVFGLSGLFLRTPFSRNIRLLFLFSFVLMISEKGFLGINLSDFIPVANNTGKPFCWDIGLIFSLIISAGFCLSTLRAFLERQKKTVFTTIGLSVVFICTIFQLLDLYSVNRKFYSLKPRIKLREVFPIQPFVTVFKKDPSLFRVSNELYDPQYLSENQGMFDGFNMFQLYSRGILLDKISGAYSLKQETGWESNQKRMPRGTLNLCNIKYILTHHELNDEDFLKLVTWKGTYGSLFPSFFERYKDTEFGDFRELSEFRDQRVTMHLYENKQCFPRAFLLSRFNRKQLEDFVLNYRLPPLVNSDIPQRAMQLLSKYKNVDIRWSPNVYEIALQSDTDSFLFLSEMFYPGWKVKLDGKAAKIQTPFNFFMGVFVPPGKHAVKFYFAPTYFYIFAGISLVTFLFLIFKLMESIYQYKSIKNADVR